MRFFIIAGILAVISVSAGLIIPKFPLLDLLIKDYGYPILLVTLIAIFSWQLSLHADLLLLLGFVTLALVISLSIHGFEGDIFGIIIYLQLVIICIKFSKKFRGKK